MQQDKKERDPRHQAMLDILSSGSTWEEAARRTGVNRTTLYRWCKADPALAAEALEARDMADDLVEAVTFGNCLDPDPSHNSLRMFWLKSRRPETYRDRVDQEHKGAVKIRVSYADDDRTRAAEAAPGAGEDPV